MASSAFGALFEDDLSALVTAELAMAWSMLKQEDWKAVATALGDEDLLDLRGIAIIPNVDYVAAVKEAELKAIGRARVNTFVNVIRKVSGLEVSDMYAAQPPPLVDSGEAPASSNQPATETELVLNSQQYFDRSQEAGQFWENTLKEPARTWQHGNGRHHPSWIREAANSQMDTPPPIDKATSEAQYVFPTIPVVKKEEGVGDVSDVAKRQDDGWKVQVLPRWYRLLLHLGPQQRRLRHKMLPAHSTSAREWCRGKHRSVNCDVHPNWVPPQPKGDKTKAGKGGKKGGRS